jgi:uncharacterized protein (UPF0332 family)/predicted nucleotidyltransferase
MKEKIENLSEIKRRISRRKELSEKDIAIKKEELELINAFSSRLIQDFGGYIHAVIVFGSFATEEMKEKSDIDVLILVDDLVVPTTSDIIGTFRVGLAKILAELNAVDKLHVNTLGLKEFWDGVRNADPVIIDILRKGFAVVDTGFFDPLKRLLIEGRIRPTPESIEAHIKRAKAMIFASKQHLLLSIDDIYWATIDSAHAALMANGILPPAPGDVPFVFEKELLKKKKVTKEDIDFVNEIYNTMKKVTKGEKKEISAIEIDKKIQRAKKFVEKMEKLTKEAK